MWKSLIDDGSTDGTAEVPRRLANKGVIDQLITHEENQGKGTAVRRGIDAATGSVVVVQDANLEYDPFALPRLLAPIAPGQAE